MTTAAAIVPSSRQPIADGAGMVTPVWQRFFNVLVQAAAPITSVEVDASPFAFRAGARGTLSITSGTVSDISITRNMVSAATGLTAGLVPVANGDVVTVTYTVAPTIQFIPA